MKKPSYSTPIMGILTVATIFSSVAIVAMLSKYPGLVEIRIEVNETLGEVRIDGRAPSPPLPLLGSKADSETNNQEGGDVE